MAVDTPDTIHTVNSIDAAEPLLALSFEASKDFLLTGGLVGSSDERN